MKKKNSLKIVIFTIILVLTVGCIITHSENIQKLMLFKKIKQAINEENNITTIDVTGIELGKETRA